MIRLDNYVRAIEAQRLSDEELAIIRQSANRMMDDARTMAAGQTLLRLLNHINIITVDRKGDVRR